MLVVAIFGRGIDKRGPYSITLTRDCPNLTRLENFCKVQLTKSLSLQKALEPLCESFNASPQKSRYQVRKSARYHHISVYLIMARHPIEIAFHRHFSQHEILLSNGCFETEVLNSKSVFHIHVFHWKEPWQAINSLS